MFFQCLVALEGRKIGLLKRRVRSHLGRSSNERSNIVRRCGGKHIAKSKRSMQLGFGFKKVHAIAARSTCGNQNAQGASHTMFGAPFEVEMLKSARRLARSAFRSQNAQSTSAPERLQELRYTKNKKNACRCGAKHISKSKC